MMRGFFEQLADLARGLAAIVAGVLPRRYWDAMPALPIARLALLSALATMGIGWVIFATGFIAYSQRVGDAMAALTVDIAERQLKGELPEDQRLNAAPIQVSALTPIAFAFFTPVGLFATYLIASAFARIGMWIVDERMGDPILTGVDGLMHRTVIRTRAGHARRTRERQEGAEVADRLYTGEWADLSGVDYVVVASRRKPGWDEGAFVITSDKWYTLGAPFDVQLPDGLRTVYPLTEQTRHEVLRRGVPYELPPLSRAKRPPPGRREPPR